MFMEMVLKKRGYDDNFIHDMNKVYNDRLKDMDIIIDLLKDIHSSQEQIVILPDFDMDGIMSGVLGFTGMVELGFNVALYLPDPNQGYGFDEGTIDDIIKQYPDVKNIITCDVGIGAVSGVKHAKDKGLRVLITDHHKENDKSSTRGIADVVINPMRTDEEVRNPHMCGAFVLWQVLDEYTRTYGSPLLQAQIRRLRVFAGIGTVSDVMPVLNDNRQLIKDSVDICKMIFNNGDSYMVDSMTGTYIYKSAFRGLYEAINIYYQKGQLNSSSDITEEFFGYYLAPMFNSLKRLGGDLDLGFGIFFQADKQSRINDLYLLNERRKDLVNEYYERILESDDKYSPYLYGSEAGPGLLGLLATKLLKDTGLPTFVLRKNNNGFSGSGRSPEWYPAVTRLTENGFFAAGHEGAFGVGVTDKAELKALYTFLEKDVKEYLSKLPSDITSQAEVDYALRFDSKGDVEFDIPMLFDFAYATKKLRPFGRGFTKPKGTFTFKPEDCEWTTIGRTGAHLKLKFPRGFEVLCWNQGANIDSLQEEDELTVFGEISINEFAGRRTLNFIGNFIGEVGLDE